MFESLLFIPNMIFYRTLTVWPPRYRIFDCWPSSNCKLPEYIHWMMSTIVFRAFGAILPLPSSFDVVVVVTGRFSSIYTNDTHRQISTALRKSASEEAWSFVDGVCCFKLQTNILTRQNLTGKKTSLSVNPVNVQLRLHNSILLEFGREIRFKNECKA